MYKHLSLNNYIVKNYGHLDEELRGVVLLLLISTLMNLYVLGSSATLCWFLEIPELIFMYGGWFVLLFIWIIFCFFYTPSYKWLRRMIATESVSITLIPILFYGLSSLFSIYLIIVPMAAISLFSSKERRPFINFLILYVLLLLLVFMWDIFIGSAFTLSDHQIFWINYVIIIGAIGVVFFYAIYFYSENTKLKHTIYKKQNELESLNNTKDQLFTIIAHDLKKPALSFRGITNKVNYLIKRKEFDVLNEIGNSIEKSAIQLNALLDNVLLWALSQKDMISVKQELVEVKQVTHQVISNLALISAEKRIKLDDSAVDQDLKIHGDFDILLTILRNLVDNAIKYSDPDSTVFISTIKLEEFVVISVKDTGQGITKEQMDKLFKVYKGKSKDGTYGEKGSGLGLNLVNDLVQKSGGTLECISFPGKGTAFKIFSKLKK